MAKAGFFYAKGPRRRTKAQAAASQTIAIGDLVKWNGSGYIALATATDDHIAGVAESKVTSSTLGDAIYINDHPDSIYRAYCSGTLTAAYRGTCVDFEGATGAQYVNENANSEKVIQILEDVDGVGANAEVFCKIARHQEAGQNAGILGKDLAADLIDGTKIADDALDSEHYVALSIDAEHLAASCVENAKLHANALTGDKIPDAVEGTPGIAVVVSKTVIATAGTYAIVASAPYKFKILDWWIQKLDATASNAKLSNGSNDITADVAAGTADHALVRGASIDNAYEDIALAGALNVITSGNSTMKVSVLIVPVA